jgi:hypothetical protein
MDDPEVRLLKMGTRGRLRWVQPDIFTVRFTPDCMAHACQCRDEGDRPLLDACCQHGADVDLFEREAILARAAQVAGVLDPSVRDPAGWFDDSDPDEDHVAFPSGKAVRSAVVGAGCVFLRHDARGCALHRAALQHGFAPEEIKPAVCRLYPLAYGDHTLWLSDDFNRYSCAGDALGPTVYRLMRAEITELFGRGVVRRLDQVERTLLGRRLPLAI